MAASATWSGTICAMTEDRIKSLDLSIAVVAKIAKRLGRGALAGRLPFDQPAA
jgi:hypothetical protein